jgi:hypothetical protein
MNGFLNTMSLTNVDQVSRVPMLWFGYGDQQFVGVGLQQPRLNCAGSGTCRFPNAHYSTFGDMGYTRRGWSNVTDQLWTGGNIYVHTDTSAKFFRMSSPGTVDSFNDTDPYTDYAGNGSAIAAAACRRPGDTQYFWCHFRPDWDFTFSNWEFVKQ